MQSLRNTSNEAPASPHQHRALASQTCPRNSSRDGPWQGGRGLAPCGRYEAEHDGSSTPLLPAALGDRVVLEDGKQRYEDTKNEFLAALRPESKPVLCLSRKPFCCNRSLFAPARGSEHRSVAARPTAPLVRSRLFSRHHIVDLVSPPPLPTPSVVLYIRLLQLGLVLLRLGSLPSQLTLVSVRAGGGRRSDSVVVVHSPDPQDPRENNKTQVSAGSQPACSDWLRW